MVNFELTLGCSNSAGSVICLTVLPYLCFAFQNWICFSWTTASLPCNTGGQIVRLILLVTASGCSRVNFLGVSFWSCYFIFFLSYSFINCNWEENLSMSQHTFVHFEWVNRILIPSGVAGREESWIRDWHCGMGLPCTSCEAGVVLFGTSSWKTDPNSLVFVIVLNSLQSMVLYVKL